jgi:hypothetical protein
MVAGLDPTMLHIAVGGASIRVIAHDETWLVAMAPLLGQPRGLVAGQIECGGPIPAPPAGAPDFEDGDARGWTQGEEPHLIMGAAHVRIGDQFVFIAAERGRGPEAFDRALPLTLTWLLGFIDLWVVHAAAVIEAEGSALLAVGPGGTGKSTVAAAALAAGWPVLADDLVVVRLDPQGSGSLEVFGVPRPLAVPREFPTLGPAIRGDVRRRRRVDADLEGGWWPVGRVAVLSHGTDAGTAVEPIAALEAFRVLRAAHFAADVPSRRAGWFSLAAQLARLPLVRIALGADPDVRLATTSQALADAKELTATGSPPRRR